MRMKDAIGNEVCEGDDVVFIHHVVHSGRSLKQAKVIKLFSTSAHVLVEDIEDTFTRRVNYCQIVVVGSLI